MTKASNNLSFLHDEAYGLPYDRRDLNRDTMVFMGDRTGESLNGPWSFVIDPFDTGLRQRWYRSDAEDDGTAPWDYHPEDGITIDVPSCWNLADDKLFHYEGGAWYARKFTHVPTAGERVFLRIGAANYETKVFINGAFVGNHLGGSTPFFVELTDHLATENRLQLYVDNRRTIDRVPMRHYDWFNYGGIFRDVALVRTPAVFIKDLFVHLASGRNDAIQAGVELSEPVDGATRVAIPGLGITVDVPINDGVGQATIPADPDLWSPAAPTLYDITASFADDQVADRVGFRHVAVDGHQVMLNGDPVFLRGICVHEDDLDLGRVRTEADIRRCFATVRDLGCNMLRLAHYPHHEAAARIADEVGLLLWEEIPVYWAIAFDNPATLDDARNQLAELIKRDRNRASVILWSVGNENPDTDARLAFMSDLVATARDLDPSRLVTAACLINKQDCRLEDRLAEHLDVIGVNEYYGWYDPDFTDLDRFIANYDYPKPVFISEVGAGAVAGNEGSETELFSERHQANVYEKQLAHLRDFAALCGLSPWLLYDFRSERRQNRFQRGFNRKGLVAADKETRKAAFDVLNRFYRSRT